MQTELKVDSKSAAAPEAARPPLMLRGKLAVVAALSRLFALLPARWLPRAYWTLGQTIAWLPERARFRGEMLFARIRPQNAGLEQDYPSWICLYEKTNKRARIEASAHIARLSRAPLISILMPVIAPSANDLSPAIESVRAQFYPQWELCVSADAAADPAVTAMLRDAQARDPRIKVVWRQINDDIAAASNAALERASGSYVALLDPDGLLSPRALYEVAIRIVANPEIDILYSDEDWIDESGRRFMPYFKPGWHPDLMLAQNLIGQLGVYRRALVTRISGFREGYQASQDHDLALRAVAKSAPERIVHIPRVLYHSRRRDAQPPTGTATLAVLDVLSSDVPGVQVVSVPSTPAWNRVIYPIPYPEPLVSVIIPTRNHADMLARTMKGLLFRTDYPSIEVLIVDNGSDEPAALSLLETLALNDRVQVLREPGPFNYSALNNRAVRASTGSLILLLNNDIDVIHPDWLRELVSQAIRPEIGAVGAKLLYPNGTIQHGGITVGMGGVAGHRYLGQSRDDPGYFGQLSLVRNVMAVTGACLMVRRDAYLRVGGLNEVSLPVAFNDVDLCLKLVEQGYRNLWTPNATLYHYESVSRGTDIGGQKAIRFHQEYTYMRKRWADRLDHDSYANPNLSLHATGILLAYPPRGDRA